VLRSAAGVVVDQAHLSDPGRDPEKQVNEDAVLAIEAPFGVALAVCDGMGGHASGERASRAAVERIGEVLRSETTEPLEHRLEVALERAHGDVYALGGELPIDQRPGSTAVVLALAGREAFVVHVGDSRAYRVRARKAERITRDHSVVEALLAAGAISPEQAEAHPDANRITRALGIAPEIEPELGPPLLLEVGDTFLLCTDGLSDLLSDAEIGEGVASAATPELACEQLVTLANSRGGHDNITVSVARVLAVGPERRRETLEMSRDGRVAATVVMTTERRPSNTLPSDRPRDTSPTLVDATVVDPAIARSAPDVSQPAANAALSSSPNVGLSSSPNAVSVPDRSFAGRPSIPAYVSTHGRLIFWVAALLCATIVFGITVWWLVR
jgi:serine/threonine protein phosphatase PrpC